MEYVKFIIFLQALAATVCGAFALFVPIEFGDVFAILGITLAATVVAFIADPIFEWWMNL